MMIEVRKEKVMAVEIMKNRKSNSNGKKDNLRVRRFICLMNHQVIGIKIKNM